MAVDLPVFAFKAGMSFRAVLRRRHPDGFPVDLTGYSARSALVRAARGSEIVRIELTATVRGLAGEVVLTADPVQTAAWEVGLYSWDVVLIDQSGRREAIPEEGNLSLRVGRSATEGGASP